jgi:hypothetical protein
MCNLYSITTNQAAIIALFRVINRYVGRPLTFCRTTQADTVDPHGTDDILKLLLTYVLESDVQLALSVLLHPARHTNARRFRQTLQACSYVDAISEDVPTVDDDVALVYSHPELDPLVRRDLGIALGHSALNLDSTVQRIHHARELDQHSVPGGLDDPPAMLGDLGIDQGLPVGLELRERTFLIDAHEAAVASHVGRQDGRESSFHSLGDQGCLRDMSATAYPSTCPSAT